MMAVVGRLWLMSLQACPLILIVLLARVLLKKYPMVLSYSLWALVGLRLLCPFFIESSFSLQPNFEKLSEEVLVQKDTPQDVVQEINRDKEQYSVGDRTEDKIIIPEHPKEEKSNNQHAALETTSGAELSNFVFHDFKNIAMLLYLAGVILLAGNYTVRYSLMKKRLRTAVKKEKGVWLCDSIQSPFVIGIFLPKIILPYGLSEQEEQYILLHEKAHIRHHDSLLRGIEILCLCLHWWNPFVWVAIHYINKDMEMYCDETALKTADARERKAYAETLLSFALRQSGLFVGLAFGESNAEQRIRNILKNKKRSGVILGVVAIMALLCSIVFLTTPKKETGSGLELPIGVGETDNNLTSTHVFERNEVTLTKPVPDYYTLDALMKIGTIRTIQGILPGASPGTWYIAENRGIVYYFGCPEGKSTENAELYSYAVFDEEYPLANGIKVGMSKEEILARYPNMAIAKINGESYEENQAWDLGFDGNCYPHSHSGDDAYLNYQGKEYWHWQDQFDYCLLAEIDGETRQGRAMALALMMREDKVEAITFYCRNDGTVTPADWTIDVAELMDKKNAEKPELSVLSNLLDKELTAESKEEQMLDWYQQFLEDGMQILYNKFAICDVDFDGKDELIYFVWGPDDDSPYGFSKSVNVLEYDPDTGNKHRQISGSGISMGFLFYENGIMVSTATHNHTYAVQDGRELWPYSVYQYNVADDIYELVVEVSAWDNFYHPDGFPKEADADGDNMVYCFTKDGSWQDGAAYEAWFEETFGGLAEWEIPYQEYTLENIEALKED